jgi:hypothetical protein
MNLAWLAWAFQRIGYTIRPYDMLADHRRWFWQPRTRCEQYTRANRSDDR